MVSSGLTETQERGDLEVEQEGQIKARGTDESNVDSEELQIQGLVLKYYSSQNRDNRMKCESEGSLRVI